MSDAYYPDEHIPAPAGHAPRLYEGHIAHSDEIIIAELEDGFAQGAWIRAEHPCEVRR